MSPDLVLLPVVHRLPAADRVHAGQGKNGGNVKIQTIAICVALALGGCQSNQIRTSNPDVDTSSDNPQFVAFSLQGVDFEYAARQAADEFLQSNWFKRQSSREWIVMMGEVVNDTTFRLDTASMTSRMKRYLVNSGSFGFTAAVGTESSATVADYRQLSRSQLFDQSTGARGQAVKPDLEMLGAIRQRTNISGDRREQQLEYEFDFRVVDLGSGIERFQAFVPIEKQGSNSNFAW